MTKESNPIERLSELRSMLKDVDFEFDCTELNNPTVCQHRQGQIATEAVLIAAEAQAHQADSLSRIADQLERIALWAEGVQK